MQMSELWRRGVVMPGSADVLARWRERGVEKEDQANYLEISDRVFHEAWGVGLFARINEKCDSLIDDHEEEEIAAEYLGDVVKIASTCTTVASLEGFKDFCAKLVELCREAMDKGMPLFFVF